MKTILITGCSSGIGLCLAQGLRKRGYHVIASARKDKDVHMLKKEGFDTLLLDVDDSSSIKNVVKKLKKIDVLINNAGYGQPGAVEDLKREDVRKQFETNVFGAMELSAAVLPLMRKQGRGRIINISSILGIVALPHQGAYNASKYALEGFTDTLRLELKNKNIKAILVEPGPIETNFRHNFKSNYRPHYKKSSHQQGYEKRKKRAKKKYPFTKGPEAVLRKVIHAVESRNPKIRYPVTFPSYFFMALKWLLTDKMLDKAIKRIYRNL
ncbi:SDR family NAD(P)-dependent oxidoreductase [Candidatus Woesearchaeota archaeon]|nr:SDR family NAD(P)-dependent oxidoreductase [Candidatus Woesearchaeota archaeon]